VLIKGHQLHEAAKTWVERQEHLLAKDDRTGWEELIQTWRYQRGLEP
jgi:hypothetical protein